jgi:hypothetical protein
VNSHQKAYLSVIGGNYWLRQHHSYVLLIVAL